MESLPDHVRWLIAAPVYLTAYAAGLLVFRWMAKRRGLATSGIWLLMQAGLFGGLVGANFIQLVATGLAGKTIEGGILGGYVAVVLMKRKLGIVRPTGDLFAPAIAAGEAIGRIGCFIGGCCSGKVTTLAFAVYDHDAFRYPTQLYMSASAAATFALLIVLERKRYLPENGLFYVQGMLFCLTRFVIEFVRDGTTAFAGMTLAQLGCVAGFLFFVWKFDSLRGERRSTIGA